MAAIALAGLAFLGAAAGPAAAHASAHPATSLAQVPAATGSRAATGTPVPGSTSVPTGAPTPGASGAPTPTGSESPSPSESAAAPVPESSPGALHPVSVGGVLYVSGVITRQHPSWDPLGGTLHVEMTVRNATDQVLDASASVGAQTLLGIDLGASDTIAVRGLAPGEIRTVGSDIGGVGQWGILKAHMTITPPETFRGVKLAPLARERWVFAPPWYLLGLVVALGVVVWVFRHYRLGLVPRRSRQGRTRRPEPGSSPYPVVIP
ncbi:MAG TPA: hypothetical protein VGC04_10290 [Cellulomonas sp.]